ncbi:MAG: hypothetical protein LBF88_12510 [Planctomycetaceae bacterium]|nr:hypothetical protein [Planctomycetaceae bacterium]
MSDGILSLTKEVQTVYQKPKKTNLSPKRMKVKITFNTPAGKPRSTVCYFH